MPVAIENSAVVITGATSGIGRAAALAFADRGASLALAARSEAALDALAAECAQRGTRAVAIPTDVADETQVDRLAARAVEELGAIDTWVNGAGVMAYGTFEQIPSDAFQRVIAVNLMGQVHGARAALREMRPRNAGVLINMSSVWGRVTTPLVSPYVVSKQAVRAFSECLRQELGGTGVSVVTMVPQAVDTPIFENAANYTGREVTPIPPIFDPEAIAAGILACAESPKREVNWGRAGRGLEILYAIAPRLYCRFAPSMFLRGSLLEEAAEPTDGALFRPTGEPRVAGGWRRDRRGALFAAFVRALGGLARGLVGRPARFSGRGSRRPQPGPAHRSPPRSRPGWRPRQSRTPPRRGG